MSSFFLCRANRLSPAASCPFWRSDINFPMVSMSQPASLRFCIMDSVDSFVRILFPFSKLIFSSVDLTGSTRLYSAIERKFPVLSLFYSLEASAPKTAMTKDDRKASKILSCDLLCKSFFGAVHNTDEIGGFVLLLSL